MHYVSELSKLLLESNKLQKIFILQNKTTQKVTFPHPNTFLLNKFWIPKNLVNTHA